MKREEAKILLQKYFEAETSIAEEQLLAAYFREEDIPEEMQPYQTWFESLGSGTSDGNSTFGEEVMADILSREKQNRKRFRTLWISVSGIAASLLIVLGSMVYYQQQHTYRDTFDNPVAALACAEKTLSFVSSEYNKGLAQLAPVHRLKSASAPLGKSIKAIEKGFAQIDKIQLVNKLNKSK
jgi:hypothetical protein